MWRAATYDVTETLREDRRAAIYRGVRTADRHPVIIKVLGPERNRPRDIERLRNEYELSATLASPSVVRPIAFEDEQGASSIVFDDYGGRSLDRAVELPMDDEPFLELAVRIAAVLADIHARGVVHKDIKPENILVHPATGEVRLTDFELASAIPRERVAVVSPQRIEGSLAYMSPEQTGRTHHAVDHRTDLYSLGVTLYQLRSGRLPLEANDALSFLHAHLAIVPRPLREVAPGTPAAISDIVAKLLAKVPEDRYESALGVKHDLERCLEMLRLAGRIDPFPLAQADRTAEFRIPERLYGRQPEVQTLLSAFDRVANDGSPSLVLVSGFAGIGKTAVVEELHGPVVRERALFLQGKFEQFRRGIPYATIAQAFGAWVREITAEKPEDIARWRFRLARALGINARLVVDLIPDLAALVEAPPVSALPLDESERRFRLVLRRFMSAFAEEGRPLVLFLDDLQWADSESLGLIEDVLTHPDTHHVLVIGAYRDNEVSLSDPLLSMAEAVRDAGADVTNLVLAPLSEEHVRELVADTVRVSLAEAEPLARLVHEKTAGNPFFTVQLLASLHEQKLLVFDARAGAFRWDLAEIQARGLSGDVVELMIRRLRSLPTATQEALKVGACAGNIFDLETVALVTGRSTAATQADLWEALRLGALLRSETKYRFLHDRIHEAACSMIPAGERIDIHLRIGRTLLAHLAGARRSEHVFQIVSQLNQGIDGIEDPAERELLAALNLEAGTRARESAAYGAAVAYCTVGIGLLPDDAWRSRRALAYGLHLERAQSEYLSRAFERADLLLSELMAHCETLLERAAPCCVGIQLHAAKGDLTKAVGLATEFLRLTGIDLSSTPTRDGVEEAYRGVLQTLGDRSIEDLERLPPMTDPAKNALMTVLSVALPAALFVDDKLWALIVCHGVRHTLEYGSSEVAPIFYVSFAIVSGWLFDRYRDGYRFGQLALVLLSDRSLLAVRASVSMIFGFLVSYWVQPVEDGIPHLERSVREGVESGNISYACYSAAALAGVKLTQGRPLAEVEQEGRRHLDFVRRMRFAPQEGNILTTLLFVQRMFGSGDLDGDAILARSTMSIPMHRCVYLVRELMAHVLLGRFQAALAVAARVEGLLWATPNFVQVADYTFFHAIALAQCGIHEGLASHERRLWRWAEECPANFEDRAALVSAEIARLDGRDSDARELYERAIGAARRRGCTHVEALAYELAAEFYAARDQQPFARAYREEARDAYERWGAVAKVRELERRHPGLAPARAAVGSSSFAVGATELNLLSVVKASQTISREIVRGDLARTLLRVILEQSGAQRGCLILVRDGKAGIVAEAVARAHVEVSLLEAVPLSSSTSVPQTLVDRVLATRRRTVIEDVATAPQDFGSDDYLQRFRPKSALCIPILRQSRAVGCLYLENSLVTGSFTPERLEVLELLAAQAAISLDNAYLLERELAARRTTEEAHARAAFLAEVGSLLTESLDLEVVLERVARVVVRAFADWVWFDLVEDGQIRRRAGAHRDPEKAPLLEELARRFAPTWESPHATVRVLHSGQSLLLPELTDEFLRRHCAGAEHQTLIRRLGSETGMIVPLRTRDQVVGVLAMGAGSRLPRFGPSELELAEDLARRAAMAIDNATHYRQAREAIRQRDEFLSIASHELRTPVSSLLLATQSMRELWKAERIDRAVFERSLNLVDRQGRRLAAQVADLLDITRMAGGALVLERSDTDLVEITREVLSRFEHELARAHSVVSIDAPEHVRGSWDPARLAQVVSNLLSNAVKFGAGRPIEIGVTEDPNRVRLTVEDHGIGFDPHQQQRIFDRYARAASARHFGGLGLGLYICRQIVEAHGGTIVAESTPGAGARLIVELPRAESPNPPE